MNNDKELDAIHNSSIKSSIKNIPDFVSLRFKNIYESIIKSSIQINNYQNKYLLVISDKKDSWSSISSMKKIQNTLYRNSYVKLILFFIQYYNIKINKDIIFLVSFIDLYIKFNFPLNIIKKEIKLEKNLENQELDNTNTYEINKFNNLISSSNFMKKNISNIKSNKNILNDKRDTKNKYNYLQKNLINKLNKIFEHKYMDLYKNTIDSEENSSYIDAILNSKLIDDIWLKKIRLLIVLTTNTICYKIKNDKNKYHSIKNNLLYLFSYLIPYILIVNGIRIFDNIKLKFKNDKYYILNSNLLINKRNKYDLLNILPSYNKKILLTLRDNFEVNTSEVLDFIKELLKNA